MLAEAGAEKPGYFFIFFFFFFRTSDLEIWHASATGDPQNHLFHTAILLQSMACVPPGFVGWLREFPWLQGEAMAGTQLASACLQVAHFPKYPWNWSLHTSAWCSPITALQFQWCSLDPQSKVRTWTRCWEAGLAQNGDYWENVEPLVIWNPFHPCQGKAEQRAPISCCSFAAMSVN